MRLNQKVFTVMVVGWLLAPALRAADYTIDPSHSNIGFKIRHFVAQTAGSFGDFSGTFRYDPKAPEKSSVDAVIQTKSISTNNQKRDGHLRSPDFFDVEK